MLTINNQSNASKYFSKNLLGNNERRFQLFHAILAILQVRQTMKHLNEQYILRIHVLNNFFQTFYLFSQEKDISNVAVMDTPNVDLLRKVSEDFENQRLLVTINGTKLKTNIHENNFNSTKQFALFSLEKHLKCSSHSPMQEGEEVTFRLANVPCALTVSSPIATYSPALQASDSNCDFTTPDVALGTNVFALLRFESVVLKRNYLWLKLLQLLVEVDTNRTFGQPDVLLSLLLERLTWQGGHTVCVENSAETRHFYVENTQTRNVFEKWTKLDFDHYLSSCSELGACTLKLLHAMTNKLIVSQDYYTDVSNLIAVLQGFDFGFLRFPQL